MAHKGGWQSAVASFIGNTGTLVFYPLEIVKTRFQGIKHH